MNLKKLDFSAKSLFRKLRLIFPAIFALQISSLPSQEVSFEKNIRIALWASTEAFPGIDGFQKKDDLFMKKIYITI